MTQKRCVEDTYYLILFPLPLGGANSKNGGVFAQQRATRKMKTQQLLKEVEAMFVQFSTMAIEDGGLLPEGHDPASQETTPDAHVGFLPGGTAQATAQAEPGDSVGVLYVVPERKHDKYGNGTRRQGARLGRGGCEP